MHMDMFMYQWGPKRTREQHLHIVKPSTSKWGKHNVIYCVDVIVTTSNKCSMIESMVVSRRRLIAVPSNE